MHDPSIDDNFELAREQNSHPGPFLPLLQDGLAVVKAVHSKGLREHVDIVLEATKVR